jgi:hypothetical protein
MLRSLLPLVVICLLIVGYEAFKQSGETNVHPVDPAGVERLAASKAGYPLLVPQRLPSGYRTTSARTDAADARQGDPVTVQLGFLTPSQEYAGYVISDDPRADAVTSVLQGATPKGTVDVGGVPWTRATDARGETVLSQRQGAVTVLVTGSAPDRELQTVAGAVRPFPG